MPSFYKKISHLLSAVLLMVMITAPLSGCNSSDDPPASPKKPPIELGFDVDSTDIGDLTSPVIGDTVKFKAKALPFDSNTIVKNVYLYIDQLPPPVVFPSSQVRALSDPLINEIAMTQDGTSDFYLADWLPTKTGEYGYFVKIIYDNDTSNVSARKSIHVGYEDSLYDEAKDFAAAIFHRIPDGSFIRSKTAPADALVYLQQIGQSRSMINAFNNDGTPRKTRASSQTTNNIYNGLQGGRVSVSETTNAQGFVTRIVWTFQNLDGGYTDTSINRTYANDLILNGTQTMDIDRQSPVPPIQSVYRYTFTDFTYQDKDGSGLSPSKKQVSGVIDFTDTLVTTSPAGNVTEVTSVDNTMVTDRSTMRYIKYDNLTRKTIEANKTQEISGRLCYHNASVESCATVETDTPLFHAYYDSTDPLTRWSNPFISWSDPTGSGPLLIKRDAPAATYRFTPTDSNEFEIAIDMGSNGSYEYDHVFNWVEVIVVDDTPEG